MGLEKLIEEIRLKSEAEALDILERAKSEAEGVIEKSESEARRIKSEARKEAAQEAQKASREQLSRSRNEASSMMDKARAQVVDRHLKEVWARILDYRESEGYRNMMKVTADRACTYLGEGSRLYCRKEDERYMAPHTAAGYLDCAGGIVAENKSGGVRLDGRLESIFEECSDRLSAIVYSQIFRGGR